MAQRPGSITRPSGYASITPNDQSSDRLLGEVFLRLSGHPVSLGVDLLR